MRSTKNIILMLSNRLIVQLSLQDLVKSNGTEGNWSGELEKILQAWSSKLLLKKIKKVLLNIVKIFLCPHLEPNYVDIFIFFSSKMSIADLDDQGHTLDNIRTILQALSDGGSIFFHNCTMNIFGSKSGH